MYPFWEGHVVLWAWGRVEEVWSSANSLPILFTISVIFCFCLFCVSNIFVFMFSTSRRRVGTLNLKWQMLAHPIHDKALHFIKWQMIYKPLSSFSTHCGKDRLEQGENTDTFSLVSLEQWVNRLCGVLSSSFVFDLAVGSSMKKFLVYTALNNFRIQS